MFEDDFLDRERSPADLEARANGLRDLFRLGSQRRIDFVKLLEVELPELFPQFAVVPRSTAELPGNFAITRFDPPRIEVREDVWSAAGRFHPRAQVIASHELAHLVTHGGQPKSLKVGPQEHKTRSSIQRAMSVERHADDIGFYFLLPRRELEKCHSLSEIVNDFSVPYKLAVRAKTEYRLRRIRKLQPYEVAHLLTAEEDPF